jgi:diguanylate cyclase (GGDEF)-like protein
MTQHSVSAPPFDAPPGGGAAPAVAAAGSGSLLPATSIVGQAMAQARRTMTAALAVSWLLLVVLVAERIWFQSQQQEVARHQAQVLRVAGELRLVDVHLTTAARLAVTTGDPAWVARFDRHHPEFEALLGQARALAPPAVSAQFDDESRAANDELTDMREAAFEALVVGAPDVARSIFDGERYRTQTELLDRAVHRFIGATVDAAERDFEAMRLRTAAIGTALLVGLVLLGVWLARRLAGVRDSLMRAEGRVQHLAATDLLTGLSNRTALHDAMAAAIARATREQRSLAVLMIDLDRFKPINDRHGHTVGDGVLRQVAERLAAVLRAGEARARYGGDEFVVLVDDDPLVPQAHQLAERIGHELARPITLGALEVSVGATVGIARYPADGLEPDELLRKADSALYRAKADNRGGVAYYDRLLDERVAERAQLEQAIRDGIGRGEFVAHLQPIVDLATRRVQSVEVLARWQHPTRGLVPPSEFIPLAEDTGLIGPMTLVLLHSACRQMASLPAHWRVSINVAPQQILDDSLPGELAAVLAEHGMAASRLDVELTETALVRDTGAARRVTLALKEAGFTVTLDDFGTGYSSLSYLAELAFDKIKIDRSFVRTLHARPQSAQIVGAVIGLSRSLGVQSVAEGIETEDDARQLMAMGCTLGQGYWFGRPAPAAQLLRSLDPQALVATAD